LGHHSPGAALPLTLELPAVASDQPATIRLKLWGTTTNAAIENDHDFDLIINGTYIDTIRWDGQVTHLAETAVPPISSNPAPTRSFWTTACPAPPHWTSWS
jgi:hypothetical protein